MADNDNPRDPAQLAASLPTFPLFEQRGRRTR
jgi:hypothetical protein